MKSKLKLPIINAVLFIVAVLITIVYVVSEPHVGWLHGTLSSLENAPEFEHQCIYNSNYYSNSADFLAASKLFYDETGMQFYLVDIDVNCAENNIHSKQDAVDYMVNYIETVINTDNAIVLYSMNILDDVIYDDNGERIWIYLQDMLYIGDSAENLLSGEAYTILNNCLNKVYYDYSETRYADMVKLFLNHTRYSDSYRVKRTLTLLSFFILPIGLLIIGIRNDARARKHRETVEILSTPLEHISESDDLVKKYTDES